MKLNKSALTVAIILIINALFSIKYISRYTNKFWLITGAMTLIYAGIYYLSEKNKFDARWKYLVLGVLGLYCLACVYAFHKIPVSLLKVDRWSVIYSFWETFFKGEYAYAAKSHMDNYPGPMPFYFILALPFYFIKEIGFLSLSGLILFAYLVFKTTRNTNAYLFPAAFLLSSPILLWEMTSRSTIFVNAVLVLAYLLYLRKVNFNLSPSYKMFGVYAAGILGGLILSTRNVFILPLIVAFVYYLKSKKINPFQLVVFGCFVLLTFITSFLPFVLPFMEDFKKINPFIVQSSFLMPSSYIPGFILLALTSGYFTKNVKDIVFSSTCVLFITICFYFFYQLYTEGFHTPYDLNPKIDISYFIFCLPFGLFYLIERETVIISSPVVSGKIFVTNK